MARCDPVNSTRICHAPLSNKVVIARFGKDPTFALGKKDATNEFFQTLASFAFGMKMPQPGQSAKFDFGGGDEQFTVVITRKDARR